MVYIVSNTINPFKSDKLKQISVEESLQMLEKLSNVGLDTETEGLDPYTKKLLSLQLGNFDFQIVFDLASYGGIIPKKIKKYLNESNQTFIIQNAKFDLKFLYKQNIMLENVFDTMLAEIILTNGLQYDGRDLATIAYKYCDVKLDKSIRGDIIKVGLTEEVVYYGANDIKYLEKIMNRQIKNATHAKLLNAFKLDNDFVKVLAYIEYSGIRLDIEKWKERAQKSTNLVIEKKQALENWLRDKNQGGIYNKYFDGMIDLFNGETTCILNWNSEKQVLPLFKSLGIKCETRKKGVVKESIDAKVLEPQQDKFDILPLFLEYKKVVKDATTYGLSWLKYINPITGRIHTTFQQLMDTGRLSSGNKRDGTPNLQNLPHDQYTRSCFICEFGNRVGAADYSGQEQIILANFSKESNLLNFYQKGLTDRTCPLSKKLFS